MSTGQQGTAEALDLGARSGSPEHPTYGSVAVKRGDRPISELAGLDDNGLWAAFHPDAPPAPFPTGASWVVSASHPSGAVAGRPGLDGRTAIAAALAALTHDPDVEVRIGIDFPSAAIVWVAEGSAERGINWSITGVNGPVRFTPARALRKGACLYSRDRGMLYIVSAIVLSGNYQLGSFSPGRVPSCRDGGPINDAPEETVMVFFEAGGVARFDPAGLVPVIADISEISSDIDEVTGFMDERAMPQFSPRPYPPSIPEPLRGLWAAVPAV